MNLSLSSPVALIAADATTAAISRYMITLFSWITKSISRETLGGFSSWFGPSSSSLFAASADESPFTPSDWNSAMTSSMVFSWIFKGALTLMSSRKSTALPRLSRLFMDTDADMSATFSPITS